MIDTMTREKLLNRGREFMLARQAFIQHADCLASMISACIEGGCSTRSEIVRTVPKYVGHSYAHVAWTLDELTGATPDQNLFYKGEDGRYCLHRSAA